MKYTCRYIFEFPPTPPAALAPCHESSCVLLHQVRLGVELGVGRVCGDSWRDPSNYQNDPAVHLSSSCKFLDLGNKDIDIRISRATTPDHKVPNKHLWGGGYPRPISSRIALSACVRPESCFLREEYGKQAPESNKTGKCPRGATCCGPANSDKFLVVDNTSHLEGTG